MIRFAPAFLRVFTRTVAVTLALSLTLAPMPVFRLRLGQGWKLRVVSRNKRATSSNSRQSAWILQSPFPDLKGKDRR